MKKTYTSPTVEKVEFNYEDQIVASGNTCVNIWSNHGPFGCEDDNTLFEQRFEL